MMYLVSLNAMLPVQRQGRDSCMGPLSGSIVVHLYLHCVLTVVNIDRDL